MVLLPPTASAECPAQNRHEEKDFAEQQQQGKLLARTSSGRSASRSTLSQQSPEAEIPWSIDLTTELSRPMRDAAVGRP